MRLVSTKAAPEAIGPYSQATMVGKYVFTAGQIALNPETMELVEGDIAGQTERVLQNLGAVLTAAGSGSDQVVKTTVYLTDMGHFVKMNEVYARFFGTHRPARATVAVASLPKNALVEIDAIAMRR